MPTAISTTTSAMPDVDVTNSMEPESSPVAWWLYLLACRDGRTYIGIALDVTARFQLHASGKGAKFTRANPPLSILGAQPFPDRSTASQAEYALKQLDKTAKLQWATQWPFVN